MNTLELLKESIDRRKPVSFLYGKENEVPKERIGNLHAIFIFTKKSGDQSTKIDLIQTDGHSDSDYEKPLPSWRFFTLDNISNVKILEDLPNFVPDEDYKPESDRYKDVLRKI